jgi:8-oxo-dGTP diphosphatase
MINKGPEESPRIRVAAIIVRGNTVLLVKHRKAGRSYWMLPGGGVRHGESLAEAVVRELQEETALIVRPLDLVLANDSIVPDGSRHILNLCFTAEIEGGTLRCGEDPRVAEAAFLPVEELGCVELFPAYGETLKNMIRAGFPDRARYLGRLWRP